jgi:hypothetical protein
VSAYIPDGIDMAKLEHWLGEPLTAFADRCDHAAKACWQSAREVGQPWRENNLRTSRRLADFAAELRDLAQRPSHSA